MNVLTATGNLGQDCRTNNVNGTAVCNFSVAIKAGYGDRAQTVWLDCALWGKAAEGKLPEYLVKGQQVAVSGELSTEEKNGKTYLKLRCNSVDLIGKREDGGQHTQSQSHAHAAPVQGQSHSGGQAPGLVTDFEDDIPFK